MMIQRSPWICGMSTQKQTNDMFVYVSIKLSDFDVYWLTTVVISIQFNNFIPEHYIHIKTKV